MKKNSASDNNNNNNDNKTLIRVMSSRVAIVQETQEEIKTHLILLREKVIHGNKVIQWVMNTYSALSIELI